MKLRYLVVSMILSGCVQAPKMPDPPVTHPASPKAEEFEIDAPTKTLEIRVESTSRGERSKVQAPPSQNDEGPRRP